MAKVPRKPAMKRGTPAGERKLYVLLPGGKPRLASEVRSSELERATAYCYTGDLVWSPIDDSVNLSA